MGNLFASVCMVAISTALFRIVAPNNTFKKQIAMLVSCFFLLGIINCLTNGEIKFNINEYDDPSIQNCVDFSGKVNAKTQKEIASQLSSKLKDILAEKKIFPEQIHIIINIQGTYSIEISEVKLVFKNDESEENKTKAQMLVNEALENTIPVTIITEQ